MPLNKRLSGETVCYLCLISLMSAKLNCCWRVICPRVKVRAQACMRENQVILPSAMSRIVVTLAGVTCFGIHSLPLKQSITFTYSRNPFQLDPQLIGKSCQSKPIRAPELCFAFTQCFLCSALLGIFFYIHQITLIANIDVL